MKKFLSITLILALALTACLCFAACDGIKAETSDVDYSNVLADYLKYPDAANDASMKAIERNVQQIFEDSSLTDAQKVAQMMERATQNEIECEYFAYFRDQKGNTNLGNNHGELIYQRLRRQSDTIKDDITIKLPINDNFDAIARAFTTSADIRYIVNGRYYRMERDSKIVYNETTGLLEVEKWKRKRGDGFWDDPQEATGSRSYDEARKSCINWTADGIISSEGIKIEQKTDKSGNKYYYLKFSANVEVANGDPTTISRLEEDNGGSGMKYNYCNFEMEIWQNGLAKKYFIDESWSGTIKIYSGSAQSKSTVVFSYSEKDMDYSKTDAIFQNIKKK